MTFKQFQWILFLLVLFPTATLCLTNNKPFSRRAGLSRIAQAVGAAIVSQSVAVLGKAQAACLPGDLSPDCIGVYKIPLQDALSSPTLNSPEALKRNAPDVNYVKPTEPPKSVLLAKEQLLAQRAAADDIRDVVLAGKLQEAGIKVLNLIPKVTGAGMTIQQHIQSSFPVSGSGANQMRVLKYQQNFQELIALWSQIDVEIGQALRGQLGVSAVAQLEILKSLKEATTAFDEFLLAVESNTK